MADGDGLGFLPKIKCSSCGADIDIAALADHICAPSAPQRDAAPSAFKLDRSATFGGQSKKKPADQSRPGRMAPPRIDSTAANKPFRPEAQLSPVNMYRNDPAVYSPISPGRPPFKMNRSATSPALRPMSPPSPKLASNLDSAFPIFPTSRSATPTGARSRPRDRLEPDYKHRHADADSMYAPLSPRTNGGENVASRMNGIAPGPFDGSDRRPSTSDGRNTPGIRGAEIGHRRTATQGSVRSMGQASNQRMSMASNASRSSVFSNGSVGLPAGPKPRPGVAGAMPPPPRPARTGNEPEGIDAFLTRLQQETMRPGKLGQEQRSKTVPVRQGSGEDADDAPTRLMRRPTDIDAFASSSRSNNMFPSRSTSRGGPRPGMRPNIAPPVPQLPTQEKDLSPDSLHTPSDSGLSDDSVSSAGFRSAASSRSSPPASVASGQHSRNPSGSGRKDYMFGDSIPRTQSPDALGHRAPSQPLNRNNATGLNRENAPKPLLPPPPSSMFNDDAPESPLDPAIQMGLLYQKPPTNPVRPSDRDAPALNLGRSPPRQAPEPEAREQVRRRPTTAARSKCRGCENPIVGKSIKDSSGRLTGRYHKQCFVCRTCGDPFPTADFYVFDNFPYCEHHYHELNGSLCQSCDRGIEGQYLETDARRKFHPRCFTCLTCRIVLRDDYFEVGGKAYCERHAFAATRSQTSLVPGDNRSRNMQKRRTRLMMM